MNSIRRAKSDSGMKSYLFKAKHNWTGFFLAFAGIIALMAANDPAGATKVRNEQFAESRPADEPIMAIISLHDQQITIYDDKGWILERRCRVGRRDARRQQGSSVLSRRKPTTTPTCTMTRTCPTCSASLGRASRSTVAHCQGTYQQLNHNLRSKTYASADQTAAAVGCG